MTLDDNTTVTKNLVRRIFDEEYETIRIEPDVFEEVTVLGRYVGHVNKNGIFKRTTLNGQPRAEATA